MKTISKQNTETQLDFDLSSFQTSNNFSKKSSVHETNTNTNTNSNNTSKHCTNSKIKQNNHKNKFYSNFSIINNITKNLSRNRSKYLKNSNHNYLYQNSTLSKENKTYSQIKKRIKTKTNDLNPNSLHFKSLYSVIAKTDYNSLNTSKSSKIKLSRDKNINSRKINNFTLKKCNTGKFLNIKIKQNKCSKNMSKNLGSPAINKFIIKTNINSPLDSNRKDKQIIKLNNDLANKNIEVNNLKKRINEQNKYINNLENKIKSINNNKKRDDDEYEQYSKKMILRNIKVLTTENEELHKQIKEYKEKEIKIMRALYYLNKKGISIDEFLDFNK